MKPDAGTEFAALIDTGMVRRGFCCNQSRVRHCHSCRRHGGLQRRRRSFQHRNVDAESYARREFSRLRLQADLCLHRNRQIHQLLAESIQHVNSVVLGGARTELQYNGMGTTLVTALFHHSKIIVAYIGGSRVYRFRQGELMQITLTIRCCRNRLMPAW